MNIYWFGQASYLIKTANGKRLLIDPFGKGMGYIPFKGSVDLVTISHDHFDHNFTGFIENNPIIINTPGKHTVDFCEITGIKSFHDKTNGSERGNNIIFKYVIDDITLCHLGDLGHDLDENTINEIGTVDVLFVPVGEVYTLDVKSAVNVVKKIKPKYIIPMHYKTKSLNIPLEGVDKFLMEMKDYKTENVSVFSVDKDDLNNKSKIVLIDIYSKESTK